MFKLKNKDKNKPKNEQYKKWLKYIKSIKQ